MAAAAGAVAPEACTDVDLPGAVNCEVLVAAGVTDTVGLAAPEDEAAELETAGLGDAPPAAGDAWPSGGALDRLEVLALAAGVD